MSKNVKVATGFESNFIKQWTGWDYHELLVIQFYEAELQPWFAEITGIDIANAIVFDLQENFVEIYSESGDVVYSGKIVVNLNNS